MKKILFALFVFLISFSLYAQNSDSIFYKKISLQVLSSTTAEFNSKGLNWSYVYICNAPTEMWMQFNYNNLPYLDRGKIIGDGRIWISGTTIKDSCYVIVKSKMGYTVEWWKTNKLKSWYLYKRVNKKLD
jgi:hypothetical protein